MSLTKPDDFPLLLEVFRDGLVLGLISKDEIITWADNIINSETEPDYFFIELSLAKSVNEICELLDSHIARLGSPVTSRVFLGLIYQKLVDDSNTMAVEQAAVLTGRLNDREILSGFESGRMWAFDDYEILCLPDTCQLQVEIINFLSMYKEFSLNNYDQWPTINSRVEEVIKAEQEKLDLHYAAYYKAQKKTRVKRKLKRYALFGIPVLIVLGIILANLKMMQGEPSWSKTLLDHEGLFYLDFFAGYLILRLGYGLWIKKRRWRKWPRMELRVRSRPSRKKGLPN